MSSEVSHGRGGAGNITPDGTKYVDGEIVRAGDEGSHGDGAFSTGRGGAANIADTDKPAAPRRADEDLVPEEATRPSQEGDAHMGRGGAGNVQLGPEHQTKKLVDTAPPKNATPNQGLADKLKHKMMGVFKK